MTELKTGDEFSIGHPSNDATADANATDANYILLAWHPFKPPPRGLLPHLLSALEEDYEALLTSEEALGKNGIIFFANAKDPLMPKFNPVAIRAEMNGDKCSLCSIKRLAKPDVPEGYGPFSTDLGNADEALEGIHKYCIDLDFKPLAVAVQLIKERNYILLGNVRPGCVRAGDEKRPVMITVYLSPKKNTVDRIEIDEL
jgi:hypothetical protein